MKKLAITAFSIALFGASGVAQADAHADMEAVIAKLQKEKSYLATRLDNAIAFSKDRAMQIDMLQAKADAEESKRKVLSNRLSNAVAFSKERGAKIDMLQAKANSEESKRKALSDRLSNAIAFSKERAAKIDMLQAKADSEESKRKALSDRLSNAVAFSKERAAKIDMLQAKADSEGGKSKVLSKRLNNAVAFSKERGMQIDTLQKQLDAERSKSKMLSKRLTNAISYSKERAKQLEMAAKTEMSSDWAAGTSVALDAAFGGVQGTTISTTSENSVKIEVGNNGLFNTGSAILSANGTGLLATMAEELSDTDANLTIVGHTDNIPVGSSNSYSSNEALSFARAVSTMEFLRNEGLPTERLAAAGFGAGSPIASNDTPEGRQKNRRVEIILSQP